MPSACGMFRKRAFTSMVDRMQFVGIVSCSSRWIRCPLSLMFELIFGIGLGLGLGLGIGIGLELGVGLWLGAGGEASARARV